MPSGNAAPALCSGLTQAGAQHSVKHLRSLLGVEALAITDGVSTLKAGPMPLWWLLVGIRVYPAILGVGWWYARAADRNESQFTDLVEGR